MDREKLGNRVAAEARAINAWMSARFGVDETPVTTNNTAADGTETTSRPAPVVINEVRNGQNVTVFKGGLDVRTERLHF